MGAAARRGRLTDTEAISSSILNFQFFMRRRHISIFPSGENISLVRRTNFTAKQFHSPKANFTATQSPWSPFPQGKADGYRNCKYIRQPLYGRLPNRPYGCRNDFNFNFQLSIFNFQFFLRRLPLHLFYRLEKCVDLGHLLRDIIEQLLIVIIFYKGKLGPGFLLSHLCKQGEALYKA